MRKGDAEQALTNKIVEFSEYTIVIAAGNMRRNPQYCGGVFEYIC